MRTKHVEPFRTDFLDEGAIPSTSTIFTAGRVFCLLIPTGQYPVSMHKLIFSPLCKGFNTISHNLEYHGVHEEGAGSGRCRSSINEKRCYNTAFERMKAPLQGLIKSENGFR